MISPAVELRGIGPVVVVVGRLAPCGDGFEQPTGSTTAAKTLLARGS